MGNTPEKYHEGNTLIHEPSGRIHFLNPKTNEYYWTAKTNQVSYKHEKDNHLKDYFGFRENSNELFYFKESRHQIINCDKLEEELASINMGRTDGVKFEFSALDSTFWIGFHDGTVYLHEKEVETQKFDMIQIQRRDYHIWDAANKKNRKMDLKFSRFIKFLGPCICKPHAPHGEDDYTQQNFQRHENLRNRNMFVLQFRDYFDLLEYDKGKLFPQLPKDPLIVDFDNLVLGHDMAYHGLYQGHMKVIAKEIILDGLS